MKTLGQRARVAAVVLAATLTSALTGCSEDLSGSDSDSSGGGQGGSVGANRPDASSAGGTGGGAGSGSAGSSASGGASAAGSGGGSSGQDAGVSNGDGGIPYPDAGLPVCVVNIQAVSAPSFSNLLVGPGRTLEVRGFVSGKAAPAKPLWTWTVDHGGGRLPGIQIDPKDPSRMTFPIETPGDYLIRATAGPDCEARQTAVAPAAAERRLSFFVRVTPPPALDVTPTESTVEIYAGRPKNQDFILEAGTPKVIFPQPQGGLPGALLPSYVRLAASGTSLVVEGDATERPLATRLVNRPYDLLIIPSNPAFAPWMAGPRTPAEIPNQYLITPGIGVAGLLMDAAGVGVIGARLAMRSGALPSTQATSGPDGRFSMRLRAGTWSFVVLPPSGSDLPKALVDAVVPVNVPDATTIQATVRYAALQRASATVTVSSSTGLSAVPGAELRMDVLTGALPDVAAVQLASSSGQPLGDFKARGELRRVLTADGAGAATFAGLPRARYRLTVVPPVGSVDGVTAVDVDLTNGTVNLPVRLAGRSKLSGALGANAAGGRLVAYDDDGSLGRAPEEVRVEPDGSFTLSLAVDRRFRVVFEPDVAGRPRTPLDAFTTTANDSVFKGRSVPSTVAFTGAIRTSGTDRDGVVPGSLVEVFCFGAAPDCVDSTSRSVAGVIPLIQATTDARGMFQVAVPDPGSP